MKGFGTVVTGTLVSGRIAVDDELAVAPGDRRVKVRGVQVHGQRQTEAVAGQRAAVNLGGVEVDEIGRGQALLAPGTLRRDAHRRRRRRGAAGRQAAQAGARVRFHQGTAEIIGRVAVIGPAGRIAPSRRSPPAGARSCGCGSKRRRSLGRGDRYILRAYSPPQTIAGGLILDPQPPRTGIRSAAALERLRRLDFDPARRQPR